MDESKRVILSPFNVIKLFNNVTGLTTQDRMSILVINVTNGRDTDYYVKEYGISNCLNFFQGLRYMV
jgi:hypothetical protein